MPSTYDSATVRAQFNHSPVHAELGTALHRIVDLESAHTRLRAALERLADVCPVTPATLSALDEACAILLETAK